MPERSWMFSYKQPFNVSLVMGLPSTSLAYDMFIFHRQQFQTWRHFLITKLRLSVWNYNEVKKILPSAVYVTLLRAPVDCFESNYVYMGLQNAYK